jgi:hypothetical protein
LISNRKAGTKKLGFWVCFCETEGALGRPHRDGVSACPLSALRVTAGGAPKPAARLRRDLSGCPPGLLWSTVIEIQCSAIGARPARACESCHASAKTTSRIVLRSAGVVMLWKARRRSQPSSPAPIEKLWLENSSHEVSSSVFAVKPRFFMIAPLIVRRPRSRSCGNEAASLHRFKADIAASDDKECRPVRIRKNQRPPLAWPLKEGRLRRLDRYGLRRFLRFCALRENDGE